MVVVAEETRFTAQHGAAQVSRLHGVSRSACVGSGFDLSGDTMSRLLRLQVKLLSGGERRRLQLAAVLMAKPNLLILDEVCASPSLTTSPWCASAH